MPGARAAAIAPPAGGRPTIALAPDRTDGALALDVPAATQASADAIVTTLPAADTAALLARLAPLPAADGNAPAVRPPSLPPPRAAATRPIAFVVPSGKPVVDAPAAPVRPVAPLPSPQIAPTGEVRAEAEVRVRFAEPMVPVARVGDVAQPPATLTPAVPGTWRWIDTRVLTFTPAAARLPQATTFTVTVPAGTRALSGATLAARAEATFHTWPVHLVTTYPRAVRFDSPVVVQLDQAIDPARLLPFLRVIDGRGKRIAVRAIDLAEARRRWADNPSIRLDPGDPAAQLGAHHVILAPVTAWPRGAELQVVLARGAPSREGPRTLERDNFVAFSVAPAFAVAGVSCGALEVPRRTGARCPANGSVELAFTNPVEPASYRADKVQLEGQPFEDHQLRGATVSVMTPETVGRTYTFAIGDGLVDVFGQPLIRARGASFTTTPERFYPDLSAPTGLHVLDPRFAIPQWVIDARAVTSVRVRLYRVQPADYFAFEELEARRRTRPPGELVHDKVYAVGPRHGADVRVDLRPALGAAGTGHVIAIATAVAARRYPDDWFEPQAIAWIQVTRLGVSARLDGAQVRAWVRDLAPDRLLAPVAGATTSILVEGRRGPTASARSDGDGHVAFALPEPAPARARHVDEPGALLVVQAGADAAFTAIGQHERTLRSERARWYVTDDRFTYKPGEQVYVKGWVRWTDDGPNPGLALPRPGETVAYTLSDARGNTLATGRAPLSAQGGFALELALPASCNLGTASLRLTTRTARFLHPISIQEFRTPAYAVTLNDDVQHAGARPLYVGERIEMSAAASYYAGGGLAGARVAWDVSLTPTTYRPPGWDRFEFAPLRARSEHDDWRLHAPPAVTARLAGTLASTSTAGLDVGVPALPGGRASVLAVDATVADVDRMHIRASSRPILVHPSSYYVGLRLRPGASTGATQLEAVVTDVDGRAVEGVAIDVEIDAVLGSERYRDDARVVDTQRCQLTSGPAPVTCTFTRRDLDHAYRAVARVTDARGRTATTEYLVPWWTRRDVARDLVVVPDRPSYQPGDVARLEISSKVVPATAIVTFARQGVLAQRQVELAQASTTIELPIEPAHVANIHVLVDRVGKRRRTATARPQPLPEEASVELELPVDVESARLEMTARPLAPLVEPGAEATFEVDVRHAGRPAASAEVALLVVDEAVLALASQHHDDPLAPFYRRVGHGTSRHTTLSLVRDAGDELDGAPGFARYRLDSVAGTGSGYGVG